MITRVVPPVPAPVTVMVSGITVSAFAVLLTPSTVIVWSTREMLAIAAVRGSAIVTVTASDHSDCLPDADVTLTARL